MKKKKKKAKSIPSAKSSSVQSKIDDDFHPDPLVEGDCPLFSTNRIFCVNDKTIQYSFREHFLFFSWENSKSRTYSTRCPPAAYHLEKRPDLKHFDFFKFRNDHKRVRFYRYALENKMCLDLLEYISENMEEIAIAKFRQYLEELRQSKILTTPIPPNKIEPLFPHKCSLIGWEYSKNKPNKLQVDKFSEWFNNLNDPLVDEVKDENLQYLSTVHSMIDSVDLIRTLKNNNISLRFETNSDIPCVTKFVSCLISEYHRRFSTKFKFALCASPGFGKTRLMSIFRSFLMIDLDDITILHPDESRLFKSLVDKRDWSQQQLEYYRVIKTKFKEGILLCQNSSQVPPDIPYLNVISPGHIGRRKLWSDRGLYDLILKNDNKIFVFNKLIRNSLVELIYLELYNSLNYVSSSDVNDLS